MSPRGASRGAGTQVSFHGLYSRMGFYPLAERLDRWRRGKNSFPKKGAFWSEELRSFRDQHWDRVEEPHDALSWRRARPRKGKRVVSRLSALLHLDDAVVHRWSIARSAAREHQRLYSYKNKKQNPLKGITLPERLANLCGN